jgi:hypothetical protein
MIPKALFVAVLEDESIFIGGSSYEKTLWLELPNKKIKRLFYTLPDGNHLCLELYDRYFHFIEATTDLNGKNAGRVNIEYAYVLGEKDEKVICYKINLKQRQDKNLGNIERTEYVKTDPFIMGLSKDGWR